jgi:hypothetical protein
MRKNGTLAGRACLAAAVALTLAGAAQAVPLIDGTLAPGEGYSLVSTQLNVTTSQSSDGGGPGELAQEANAGSTGHFTNLSNAYAQIDPVANALDLFIGGSMEEDNDSKYQIALQLNGNGVTSLAGQTINGAATSANLDKIMFSNGFAPSALFTIFPGQPNSTGVINMSGSVGTATGAHFGVSYTDLTGLGYAAPASVGAVLNNTLVNTAVGSGSGSDPGFANASTGLEVSIPLASLGYTPGTPINVLAFPTIGSDGRTNDQILAPFTSFADSNGYDYTYIDNSNSTSSPTGRQFVQAVYPGAGFFTVTAPVPEPTSLAALGLAAVGLLSGRTRKAKPATEADTK